MAETNQMEVPCCPPLSRDKVCDVLDFHYRLTHPTTVVAGNRRVQVEVLIHVRFERCPGPMTLGDLAYSTTLLPGEKVRLFTSDRRSRFTFDSSTKVSYRNEQTSEERYYSASLHDFMSDVSVRDSGSASSSNRGSAKGHAGTSGAIQSFFGGASVDVSGSYEASSTSDFLRELSQHASSSDRRAEIGTRAASSVSVGEVSSRTHTESESSDHFESASREFSNPNKCHAVTFFFYQINQTQTVRFKIVAIQRRVIDPAADTRVTNNPFVADGDVSAIPNAVLATDVNRLQVEEIGRASELARLRASATVAGSVIGATVAAAAIRTAAPEVAPIPAAAKARALAQVDAALQKQGLIDKKGQVTEDVVTELSFERVSSLPTPGLLVKGCLDDCDICEPSLDREIELDLERKALENELLKKQIELLEKSQQYRCCPVGEEEATETS
ncbi:MAG TPA: hypothetical protein PLE54_14340 [Burkholderiaceae bacterium]|nr:hypothetical protein [Burkholderiaceae bacterium]HQR71785.1 hypothetical protein [Burkholderiaceae bacterium]